MGGIGGSTPSTNFNNFSASSNTPGAPQQSGQPMSASQKEQSAQPQWNKSNDDDTSIQDALKFLQGDPKSIDKKGSNTGNRLAELVGALPTSFDWSTNVNENKNQATLKKWNDGVKKLIDQHLQPKDFAKQIINLEKQCSPRPGEGQIFTAQVQNVQQLAKDNKLQMPSPMPANYKGSSAVQAWMAQLQSNLSKDLTFDASVDATCGLSGIDGYDPSQDDSAQALTKALSGGDGDD